MKLAVAAAAILAAQPHVVSSSSLGSAADADAARSFRPTTGVDVGAALSSSSSSSSMAGQRGGQDQRTRAAVVRRRLVELSGQGGATSQRATAGVILRNVAAAAAQQATPQEWCDPSADVGVLSCGEGRYCLESSAPGTMGTCVDDDGVELMDRTLQEDANNATDYYVSTPKLDIIYALCDGGVTYPGLLCQCSGVDPVNYVATANCAFPEACSEEPDVCGDTNVTFCSTSSFDFWIIGPGTTFVEYCQNFTAPEAFSYCASDLFSYFGTTCKITVSDVLCDVCTPYTNGRGFDCINTPLNYTGYAPSNFTIVQGFIALQYNSPIYDGRPCPSGCNLCGGEGGYMTNTDVTVTLPITGDVETCGQIEFAALTGVFANSTDGVDLCQVLPALVNEPCGCSSMGGEGMMSGPPVAAPTPTDEDGAATTGSPSSSTGMAPSSSGAAAVSVPTKGFAVATAAATTAAAAAMVVGSLFFFWAV